MFRNFKIAAVYSSADPPFVVPVYSNAAVGVRLVRQLSFNSQTADTMLQVHHLFLLCKVIIISHYYVFVIIHGIVVIWNVGAHFGIST